MQDVFAEIRNNIKLRCRDRDRRTAQVARSLHTPRYLNRFNNLSVFREGSTFPKKKNSSESIRHSSEN